MTTEELIQEAILTALDTALAQEVVEQAIPDSQTVKRDASGKIKPYVAIQFGDLQQGVSRSFVGPRGDDYVLPVYVQAVAPTAKSARQIINKVRNVLLGADYPWSGNVRKRAGGMMYPVAATNAATEAYVSPASFGVVMQFGDLNNGELD